jgi:adenylosuccinate lyase
MLGVQRGGDRQTLHEVIRKHAVAVKEAMDGGAPNDLVDRLANDPAFGDIDGDAMREQLDPTLYTGRAARQVTEFLSQQIEPLRGVLRQFRIDDDAEVTV